MAYSREALERLLARIPRGRVTRHGLLATALETTPRGVARGVCTSSNTEGRMRVVMKGGWFPHQDRIDDCRERAEVLEREGLRVSSDRRRVLVTEEELWVPE